MAQAMMKASSGVSVMRADLDATTSTSLDAHESQWRAGVNRKAQPDAISHQLRTSRKIVLPPSKY